MISRRDLLKLSGLVGLVPSFPALARELAAPDYKIEIAPVTLDLSPRHKLKTTLECTFPVEKRAAVE